ncbi:DUF916 and DUF3324 domain-containing protein [Listeria booriae]|uniref:DUF916 and DUF3324 domain-containing protein n=1 Tax=Listeria booriae TaxID=1552123 RepID=UPI001624D4AC|nr:DUF916 and DUF3324 domain-containing protein [Listeria booriae]MBC1292346.1 DUF916 and DUF3324 domain-containing protein [Listeria booriae]
MLLIVLIFFGTGTINASAADMNYSVQAIIPENQVDKTKTYYDLKVVPGSKQELSLQVENHSDKKTTLEIGFHTAKTNKNGVINYGGDDRKSDDSLEYNLEDLIEGPSTVELKPNETKRITYTLNVPEKVFDGILLGGFYVHKKLEDKETTAKDVQIENDYSYVIGLKVTENGAEVKPDLKLNSIYPGLQNYRTTVFANIQNIKPVIISGMTVEASIYEKNGEEVLHHTKKENQTMAPNSNYDFGVSWDNQPLEPGIYTLKLKAEDGEGNKWSFQKNFEIGKEVKEVNREAVEVDNSLNWWLISIICLAVIFLIVCFYILFRKKKRKNVDG